MIKRKLEEQLKSQFHISSFRPGQEEIIQDIMDGHDVLAILPTGSGKSLCYQLPASLSEGLTIVVSPLISLMEDQVKQLKAIGFKAVEALNSFMDPREKRRVLQQLDQYKLIYLSPEILQQKDIIGRLKQITVDLLVIDEAHCISQWGHEFRPDYLRLGDVLKQLHDPAVMALSATATKEVQHDIIASLDRPDIVRHIYPMDRENITFTVKKVENDRQKQDTITRLLKRYRVPTLIYFSSKRKTEEVAAVLSKHLPSHRIAFYHGGMDQLDRVAIQQQFMNDQLDIICCTSAFGMGINKQDIRLVLHYHFPLQIESYLQEIGRAGRDGQSSVSLLLYSPGDEALPKSIIANELPQADDADQLFRTLYQLYLKEPQLPSTDKVLDLLEVTEIQWRFLHYQMEKHGMIKNNQLVFQKQDWEQSIREIKQFMIARAALKQRKLDEITSWIHEERCLREHLYKGFQNNYKSPTYACCSNCGFSFKNWVPEQTRAEKTIYSWETKLKKLFFIGDYDSETK
ncbi:RecQ family ATP-dependent DNA helicase [Lentibacillus salicampi]|uniref:ATP-dependent DNA helicase RecQ n=1 Tax=Lentibacillus salicampi TaxID=175306 RepID=A0A4Y9AD16_9BACI|nr:ATP-dependent DNA helicase RecQ [Lentibacillus salicampi]TFJ93788.1 ATP-dependent DNA helicase RecQ [Lentibacillus salicampi]